MKSGMSELSHEQILANRRRVLGEEGMLTEAQLLERKAAQEKAAAATVTRGYTTLTIRAAAADGGKRRFTGIASTIGTDMMGDIVEPRGMQAKLPVPCLWQHDHAEPIGWVTATRVSEQSIEADFEIAEIAQPGPLKDRLDTAWQSITSGLVRGLSIGFKPIEAQGLPSGGMRYRAWQLLEVSAVTIAANGDCSITQIRSADMEMRRTATPRANPIAAAQGLVKSFNAATEAGDLEEMIRLFNGKKLDDAIALLTATDAHDFVEGHWRGEIKRGNGERKPVTYTEDVHDAIFFVLKTALARIARLEAEVHQRAAIATARMKRQHLRYRGVYKHGETYQPGNFATFGGSVWACTSKTADPPGGTPANPAWTLAVRRGSDGRDAR